MQEKSTKKLKKNQLNFTDMEQLTEFQLFIKSNKLKQKQVADYLETSPQYINQVAKGLCDLSDEKYERLVQSDWDVSMLNIPPYIKVPATISVFSPTDEERKEIGESVDIKAYPAEVVEEIKAEVAEEIKEEMAIPIISPEIANDPKTNIKKYIKEKADELEHIYMADLTQGAKMAERVRKTSMSPTFQPGDYVFINIIDKDTITDGNTYYFDLNTRPTMIRKVKIEGDRLRLIAENPTFGDVIIGYDEINNIAEIVGLFRSYFGDQYYELESVRRKKDEQINNLIQEVSKAGSRVDRMMEQMTVLVQHAIDKK